MNADKITAAAVTVVEAVLAAVGVSSGSSVTGGWVSWHMNGCHCRCVLTEPTVKSFFVDFDLR